MKIRPTTTMRARIKRFTLELGLPSDSHFVLYCIATQIDELIAKRGEILTAGLADRSLRAHLGRVESIPRPRLEGEDRPRAAAAGPKKRRRPRSQ